jgi:hypothetical protein
MLEVISTILAIAILFAPFVWAIWIELRVRKLLKESKQRKEAQEQQPQQTDEWRFPSFDNSQREGV